MMAIPHPKRTWALRRPKTQGNIGRRTNQVWQYAAATILLAGIGVGVLFIFSRSSDCLRLSLPAEWTPVTAPDRALSLVTHHRKEFVLTDSRAVMTVSTTDDASSTPYWHGPSDADLRHIAVNGTPADMLTYIGGEDGPPEARLLIPSRSRAFAIALESAGLAHGARPLGLKSLLDYMDTISLGAHIEKCSPIAPAITLSLAH